MAHLTGTLVALALVLVAGPDHLVEWGGEARQTGPFVLEAGSGAAFAPLRLVHPAPPAPAVRALSAEVDQLEVTLWNGDRVRGRLGPGGGDAVHLIVGEEVDPTSASQTSGGWNIALPLDALSQIRFTSRRAAAGTEDLRAPTEGDRLYRLAGSGVDVVDGTLDAIESSGLAFESRLGRRIHPWSEVVALFVEPLDPPEATRGQPGAVSVDLVGGTRLHGVLEAFDSERVRLRLPWDQVFEVAPAAVLLVTADDDRIVHLSSLTATSISGGTPFEDDLGLVFRPVSDRAVHGAPLVCGGRTWARGIGVHAPTTLVYEFEAGTWSRLRGAVGIDDSTADLAARGAVHFVVRGDGRELWRSDVVRGGRPPVQLPVLDVSAVARLELEVEMGPELNLGDRANWLDLRLER